MPAYRAKPPKGALLNRAEPLAKGLVVAYPFNEGGGNTAYSAVGKLHGSLIGFNHTAASGWGSGPFGKCLVFDGSGDTIAFPAGIPALGNNCTFAAWVRLDAAGNFPMIISFGGGFELRFNGGSRQPMWLHGNAGTDFALSPEALTLGTWNRLVGVSDGALNHIYVNGVLKASSSTMAAAAFGSTGHIGSRSGTGLYLTGRIDLPCIWNRGLNAKEVRRDFADSFRILRRRGIPIPIAASAPSVGWPLVNGGLVNGGLVQ
jgi:hypothetical protein